MAIGGVAKGDIGRGCKVNVGALWRDSPRSGSTQMGDMAARVGWSEKGPKQPMATRRRPRAQGPGRKGRQGPLQAGFLSVLSYSHKFTKGYTHFAFSFRWNAVVVCWLFRPNKYSKGKSFP